MAKTDLNSEEFPSEKNLDTTKEETKKKTTSANKKQFKATKDPASQALKKDQATVEPKSNDSVVDKLLDKNQQLEKQLKQAQDQYLRAEAEIQNIKRHNQQDQATLIKYDGQKLATAILPSIDNLERALAAQEQSQAAANEGILTGVQMVLKHLKQALAENNVVEIAAAGEKFDPTVHQAVQTVPADADHPAETVVQVLQTGYKLKDRVIRPSMVVVAQ